MEQIVRSRLEANNESGVLLLRRRMDLIYYISRAALEAGSLLRVAYSTFS